MKPSAGMLHHRLISAGLVALALATGFSIPAAAQRAGETRPSPSAPQLQNAAGTRATVFGPARDYPLMAGCQPAGMIASGTAIWFSASNLGALGRLDRATGTVTYFPLGTGARPMAIAEMPDRAIIAADRGLNVLHRLNPENGEATRIAMPPELPFLDLADLRVDLEGKVWFTGASGWLGSHDPRTGQTEVSSHDDLQGLAQGATAPNGTLWFVAGKSARMIHVDPQKSRFDSAALPPDFHGVRGVAVGPNGEVWIASMKFSAIARYSGRGTWVKARLPWADSRPQAMVVRADGTVIIADAGRRKLIRYSPALDRFDEAGELGAGGAIKAMVDLGDGIAIADIGADRIRIFPDEPVQGN